jgi:hypothetical protein
MAAMKQSGNQDVNKTPNRYKFCPNCNPIHLLADCTKWHQWKKSSELLSNLVTQYATETIIIELNNCIWSPLYILICLNKELSPRNSLNSRTHLWPREWVLFRVIFWTEILNPPFNILSALLFRRKNDESLFVYFGGGGEIFCFFEKKNLFFRQCLPA